MTAGSVLLALGVSLFEIPNGFITGGVSSLGLILAELTPIRPGAWIWMLNGGLLLLGFLILGRATGVKTVYCSMLYSALTFLLELYAPFPLPLSSQPLLELIYAILLTAGGSGIIFFSGGSSGGTDIMALIIKRYTGFHIGPVLFLTDLVAVASAFFFFGSEVGLLSLLGLLARAFLIDALIQSLCAAKYFIVITSRREEITSFIIEALGRGVTAQQAVGEYSGEQKVMLHTVCKRHEAARLRQRIKQIDPDAFIIVTEGNEVVGSGFRSF